MSLREETVEELDVLGLVFEQRVDVRLRRAERTQKVDDVARVCAQCIERHPFALARCTRPGKVRCRLSATAARVPDMARHAIQVQT